MNHPEELTALLRQATDGNREARERLMPLVYDQLRGVAHRQLRQERPEHTLSPTALVHEAWLKLDQLDRLSWQNRTQYFAIAANLMRRVLVDHAVARKTQKRGGGVTPIPLDEALHIPDLTLHQVLVLDDLLEILQGLEPRHARIVELRFFAGLTIEETAGVLKVSPATIKRDWALLRAWLRRELGS